MIMALAVLCLAALHGALASPLARGSGSPKTTVRYTGEAPTGYVVDFVFQPNSSYTPQNVTLTGLPLLTDLLHTTTQYTAGYPLQDYKYGDFPIYSYNEDYGSGWGAGFNNYPFQLIKDNATGVFIITLPLQAGTYVYGYYLDCPTPYNVTQCTIPQVYDDTNPPIQDPWVGQETHSQVQVPWDGAFQPPDQNYFWSLPWPDASKRGSYAYVNYSSPGSVWPVTDIHQYGIYLPPGYDSAASYPVLYLSHGGGNLVSNWQNMGRASNILDHLINTGQMQPTIMVNPGFYNTYANTTVSTLLENPTGFQQVAYSYLTYLFPFIEAHYSVSSDPTLRAIAGMSLGNAVVGEFFWNHTDYFGHYGFLSGAPGGGGGSVAIGPLNSSNAETLRSKGIFTGAGTYDLALLDALTWQLELNSNNFTFVNHWVRYGAHMWQTWQELVYTWGRTSLWASTPYTVATGHGKSYDTAVET